MLEPEKGLQDSVTPTGHKIRALRKRLTLQDEFALALLPTATVLIVFALVEVLSRQRLLFSSLASSAFLIYLDPENGMNRTRTLITAQLSAAVIGLVTYEVLGAGYVAGGVSMLLTITLMIALDVMHPPAVSTSLAFAFRAGQESNLLIFVLAVGVTVLLLGIERFTMWRIAVHNKRSAS